MNGEPIVNWWKPIQALPARTAEGEKMGQRSMLKRGFNDLGPAICYAFMQAVGMVNDHQFECFGFARMTRKI